MPIYTFSVAGPYSSEIIYERIKDLESSLKAVPGAGDILVNGKPTKEISQIYEWFFSNKLDQIHTWCNKNKKHEFAKDIESLRLFITVLSPLPRPNAKAGKTSVTMFKNRICKGKTVDAGA